MLKVRQSHTPPTVAFPTSGGAPNRLNISRVGVNHQPLSLSSAFYQPVSKTHENGGQSLAISNSKMESSSGSTSSSRVISVTARRNLPQPQNQRSFSTSSKPKPHRPKGIHPDTVFTGQQMTFPGEKQKLRKFGNIDLTRPTGTEDAPVSNTKSLGSQIQPPMRPTGRLGLDKMAITDENLDLSPLEIYPYLETIKDAIVTHNLEELLASVAGVLKYGGSTDLFQPEDNEETVHQRLAENSKKQKANFATLLDNVKAIVEVLSYDLEMISDMLSDSSLNTRMHCSINTFQHLLSVYNIVPVGINHPEMKLEHCDIDKIAENIVLRSEVLDIPENGPDVYKTRHKNDPIRIITPLIGIIYMLLLNRYGFTAGLVHTPTIGLVYAHSPLSKEVIMDPKIAKRTKQNSPYWFINNVVADHTTQYIKPGRYKLTPVDCQGLCTPAVGNNFKEMSMDFTCTCTQQPDGPYGGNFVYIDFLINRIGQIPYAYAPDTPDEVLTTQNIDISSDVKHLKQKKQDFLLPYPIYSYKCLAMRLIYEPIFANNITKQLATNLELAAAHISSHISNDPHLPKKLKVRYAEIDPEDTLPFGGDHDEFSKFLDTHDRGHMM